MADNIVLPSIGYYPDPDRGYPIANGQIYIGAADLDPTVEANRITVELVDENGAIIPLLPSSQPLRTGAGGVPIYNGSPVTLTVSAANYSLTVQDNLGSQKYYMANAGGSANAGGGGSSSVSNRFRNGGMIATFNPAINLTDVLQEGEVSGIYGAVTTVTGGTLERQDSGLIGTQGYACAMAGVTAGAIAKAQLAVNLTRASAYDFLDETFSVQIKVRHDYTGGRLGRIELYSPNANIDDFSAMDLLYTSSDFTVPSGVTFQVSDVIDTSILPQKGLIEKGLQIRFVLDVGSSAANNILWSDFSVNLSGVVSAYQPFSEEIQETENIRHLEVKTATNAADIAQLNSLVFGEYINGMGLTSGADADHDIIIDSGLCSASGDVKTSINLSSSIEKQADITWAEGNAAGGKPSGVTLTANTWLYIFVISRADGTADAGYDDDAAAVNLLADATGYVNYRCIGAIYVDASLNIEFIIYKPDVGIKKQIKVFTSSGSFRNPPWGTVIVTAVGGGGGGAGLGAGGSGGTTSYGSHAVALGGNGGVTYTGGAAVTASVGDITGTSSRGVDGANGFGQADRILGGESGYLGFGQGGDGGRNSDGNELGSGASGSVAISYVNSAGASVTATVGAGGAAGTGGGGWTAGLSGRIGILTLEF